MAENPLLDRNNIFETTVDQKRASVALNIEDKKAQRNEFPISAQLDQDLNALTQPTPPPSVPYTPPKDVLEAVGTVAGAGIIGAAQIIFDAPLSAPAVIADALSAGAKEVLSPEDYQNSAKSLQAFRKELGFLDFVGDKIVEKTERLYGDPDGTTRAEAQLRQTFQRENSLYDLSAGIIETAVDNPTAIAQITAQSLPQMAALASKGVPFAIAFMDLVGDRVTESKNIYREKFGQEPQGKAYFNMLATATVATSIETIESRFLLDKIKPPTNKVAQVLEKVPLARTTIRGIEGAGAEFFQEGAGEILTELGGRQSLDALTNEEVLEQAFVSGGLGAGSGAGIAVGVNVLPDTARAAEQAANVAGAAVDKGIELTQNRKRETAIAEGNNLGIAEAGLETDFTKLNSDERLKKITEIFDALSAIDAEAETETDPVKRKAILDSAETAQERFRNVLQQNADLSAQEQSTTTVKEAEAKLAESVEVNEENTQAVQQVVEAISEGNDVDTRTVTSIKGSKLFDILDTGQKELLNLYEDYSKQLDGLEKVSSDILEGNTEEGFLGIRQQQQRVAQAIKFGNQAAANVALRQLRTLRESQVAKLAAPPKNKKFKTHSAGFIKSVNREIEALTTAINFLDRNVKQAFETSVLSDTDLAVPEVTVFEGTQAQAQPETSTATETTAKPTEVISEAAKTQLQNRIESITDEKTKGRAKEAFSRSKTKAQFERVRKSVNTVLKRQQEIADKQAREAVERQAAAINEEAETDTDTDVEVSAVGKIEGFDAILDMNIPKSTQYRSKNIKQRVKIGNKTLKNTYRTLIIRQDNLLRAVQDIVRMCNG